MTSVNLVETIKNSWEFFFWNSNAGIAYGNFDKVVIPNLPCRQVGLFRDLMLNRRS
jgi:hypothetical protein